MTPTKKGSNVYVRYTMKNDVTGEELTFKANSFVDNMANFLFGILAAAPNGAKTASVVETDGSPATPKTSAAANFGVTTIAASAAGAGSNSAGIRVGTGDTAFDHEDYELDTIIDHGTGAGELEYGASTTVSPVYAAGNITFSIKRTFVNSSGSSIEVKEVGIAVFCDIDNTEIYFLLDRTVLDTSVIFTNGTTWTVTAEFTVESE
jgi:hypothetical protein